MNIIGHSCFCVKYFVLFSALSWMIIIRLNAIERSHSNTPIISVLFSHPFLLIGKNYPSIDITDCCCFFFLFSINISFSASSRFFLFFFFSTVFSCKNLRRFPYRQLTEKHDQCILSSRFRHSFDESLVLSQLTRYATSYYSLKE